VSKIDKSNNFQLKYVLVNFRVKNHFNLSYKEFNYLFMHNLPIYAMFAIPFIVESISF